MQLEDSFDDGKRWAIPEWFTWVDRVYVVYRVYIKKIGLQKFTIVYMGLQWFTVFTVFTSKTWLTICNYSLDGLAFSEFLNLKKNSVNCVYGNYKRSKQRVVISVLVHIEPPL